MTRRDEDDDDLRERIARMRECNGQQRGATLYYPQAQPLYLAAGFTNVLPLPAGKKKPVPAGFTGYKWRTPTPEDLARLARDYPNGNTAIHTGDTLIGFDKDGHSGKTGAQTMAEAERRWGALPPTWSSSSRDDGSGIFWYRVPAGTHLVSEITFPELGIRHVDVIQYYHRYGLVWPSIHPDTGQMYVWRDPGWVAVDTIPNPGVDFSLLTEGWLEGLKKPVPRHRQRVRFGPPGCCFEISREPRRREQQAGSGAVTMTAGPASNKVAARPAGKKVAGSNRVAGRLAQAIADLGDEGNRHDVTRDHVLAILRLGEMGESGVADALDELCEAFVEAVTDDGTRSPAEAEHEFARMVAGGEDIVDADPSAYAIVRATWPRQNWVKSSRRRKRVAWGTGGRR